VLGYLNLPAVPTADATSGIELNRCRGIRRMG
jgi:hypothetical protein